MLSSDPEPAAESLDRFLAGVERRAYQMARVSTGDPEAALDIVQDAMLKLVRKYRNRNPQEWPPLFYRILSNTIKDWQRKGQRSGRIFDRWFGSRDEDVNAIEEIPAAPVLEPIAVLDLAENMAKVNDAVSRLSPRQQQAFLLRCWAGFSLNETASIMGCTTGTVKTLYSRALHAIRQQFVETT